ncbi:MAG: outer membrane protein transport protein [Methylococcaceae bacterium]
MKFPLLKTTVAVLVLSPTLAQATNGYFAHGYGVRNKSMGGVGAALSQDAVAAAVNPAGMAFVDNRLDLELELFSPHREYTVSGMPTGSPQDMFPLAPGTRESGDDYFVVPTVGWNHRLDDTQTVGVTLYGNGGMNTTYRNFDNKNFCPPGSAGGSFCGGKTGIDLMQAFIVPSYAKSFYNQKFSLGIAPIFAVQSFKAKGLGAFGGFSSDAGNLSNSGRDYSYGAGVRVGTQAEVLPHVKLGFSYKSRIFMSPFSYYQGLFAEQGDFDIPESFNGGIAWEIQDGLTTAFDVEHINYSSVASVGNSLLPNLQTAKLGNNGGAGFGWQDMTVYKFGVQWKQNQTWTWRGGFSYGEQPIQSSQVLFNTLAPGVQQWHITAGLSHELTKQDELSLGLMYSPTQSVSGKNPLSPTQEIDLQMYQVSLQAAWSHRF